MITNPSPKSLFQSSKSNLSEHHRLLETPALQLGCQTALLEMQRRLATVSAPPDMGGCAAAWLRLQGAQEFLDIFLNLAEATTLPPRARTENLASNVPTQPKN